MSRACIAASWRVLTASGVSPPQDYSWALEEEARRWSRAVAGLPPGALEKATLAWMEKDRPGLYPGHTIQGWPTPRVICLQLPRALMRKPPGPADPWVGPIGCVLGPYDDVREVRDDDLSLGHQQDVQMTLVDRGWTFWSEMWEASQWSHPAIAEKSRVSIRLLGFHPRWPSPSDCQTLNQSRRA